jgi:hypothetical protein
MTKAHRNRLTVLMALLAILLCIWGAWRLTPRTESNRSHRFPRSRVNETEARAFLELEARERQAEQTVWSKEIDAQRHEDVFLKLWDTLNQAAQPFAALAEFGFEELLIGKANSTNALAHGIHRVTLEDASQTPNASRFTLAEWRKRLNSWQGEGWTLGPTTWREASFSPAVETRPAVSLLSFSARITNALQSTRAILRGELEVAWRLAQGLANQPVPQKLTLKRLECLTRSGPTPFDQVYALDLPLRPNTFADPLLLSDVDGDGVSEIVLVGANKLLRREGVAFHEEPLASLPPTHVMAALLLDLTGEDGPDLLVAYHEGLLLFENNGRGRFPSTPFGLWRAPNALKHPQVITAGDVDGDGDLDLWLGQYKLPYQLGQFPTPYFDANDGFPAYLLRNDGDKGFTDITDSSGLEAKRWRRAYSASFVDLNQDGKLDLVTVSDFAGLDVFLNQGAGHFIDVTDRLADTRHSFGMSHAITDINSDGWADLYVLGMDSPTAGRLNALGLARPTLAGLPLGTGGSQTVGTRQMELRAAMVFGNRLFLGGGDGLRQSPFAHQLAHAGWAWGVSFFDFDNDADVDVAISNGHETAATVRDYERQFWLHDIYVGQSTNNRVNELYFGSTSGRRRGEGISYGGWQDNVFFLNSGNNQFAEVAFLLGLAVPEDSQNLVSDDLDGDGRLDLVLTTFGPVPDRQPRLHWYRNRISSTGNWIGFRFDSAPKAWSGTRVQVETPLGTQTRWLVTGDSYRSQHAPAVHFGLGAADRVSKIEIQWPDGSRTHPASFQVNHWNPVRP